MGSWYSDNAARRYPIDDTLPPTKMVRSSDSARVDLPMPTIVDCGFLFGPGMSFDPSLDDVYLDSITRAGSILTFVVECSTTGAVALIFRRQAGDPDWATSWSEATTPTGGPPPSDGCSFDFIWRGFLVTGDLSYLFAVLPDGATLVGGPAMTFEPTLSQSLRDDYVRAISVANQTRTTVATPGQPPAPPAYAWNPVATCMTGQISVYPGFNATVDQDASSGILTLGGSVGAGAGQPCAEITTYPGEPTPAGSTLLSGGPTCNSLILQINGLTGSAITLAGGLGVTVTADPGDPHGIIVDFENRLGMVTGP